MWPRAAPGQRIYVDFDPPQELVQGKDAATLRIVLPGFKKEHIKIGINNYGRTRITGERQIMADGRWSRFIKEFQVQDDCDASKISARFVDEVLQVTLPKLDSGDGAKDNDEATRAAADAKVDDNDGSKNGTARRAESGAGGSAGGGGMGKQLEEEQKVEDNGRDRTEEDASCTDKVTSDSKRKNLRNMVQLSLGSRGRGQLMLNGVAAAVVVLVGVGLYGVYKR